MKSDTEFIADCLWRTIKQLKKLQATLIKQDLSDKDRGKWLSSFKILSRLYRKVLHTADDYTAVSEAELAMMWREFVKTGETVCREQTAIINMKLAKLGKPRMSAHQLCAHAKPPVLASLACVKRLNRDFERYKNEMMQLAKSP